MKDCIDHFRTKQNRERTIEESKFLGGDIEHTHLVKGLDYALLRKTRASKVRRGSIKV